MGQKSWCRYEQGEPSPGADVAKGEPSPGSDAGVDEPSPDVDVAGVGPVPVQMWQVATDTESGLV